MVTKLDCPSYKSRKCVTVVADEHGIYINQVVVYVCNRSTQEMEAEGSEVLGHPHLCMEFGVNQATPDSVFKGG